MRATRPTARTHVRAGARTGEDARGGDDVLAAPTHRGARDAPGPDGAIDPRVGTVVAGRYRVVEALGHGGMGSVYRVRDLTLDLDVAMKRLPASDAVDLERIGREVRLARKVTHANVCRLHDLTLDGDDAYLTMELVRGESLAAWLERAHHLDAATALPILRDVARGLAAAHAAGVIHRDLKPANVLVEHDAGRALVADFGIATAPAIAADRDDELAGTLGYMAPEQLAGGAVDTRADVWAFGALACRALVGAIAPGTSRARASAGGEVGASMPALLSAASVPTLLGDHVPAALIALLTACLADDPDARPRDGAALVAALDAVNAVNPVDAVDAANAANAANAVNAPDAINLINASGPRAGAPRRWRGPRAMAIAGAIAALLAGAWWGLGATQLREPASPRWALGASSAGDLGEDQRWAIDALPAVLAEELLDAWGLELVARDAPGARILDAKLGWSSGAWTVRAAGVEARATSLREAAAGLATALVQRDVPAPLRRPTAADLTTAGAVDAAAWRAWRRARRQAMLQHWERAQALCREALATDPGFALAALELALAYDAGDAAQGPALAHAFELAARRPPGPGPWRHALALLRHPDDAKAIAAELDAARAAATEDLDRRFIEIRWALGLLFTNRDEEAVPLLELARERWPDEGSAWKALARHYVHSDTPGALALALAASERAQALLPDDVGVRADRALALVRTGEAEKARQQARLAERIDPAQRATARAALFEFHLALGNTAEASAEAQRMLGGPARLQAQGLVSLATLDLLQGRFDRGFGGLDSAAQLYDRLGMTVAAARTRAFAARQALALERRDAAAALLAPVADGATHYAPAARIRLLLLQEGAPAARRALAARPAELTDRARLELELAAASGDDRGVIDGHRALTDPLAAMSALGLAAAAHLRLGHRADAIELYRALAAHPDGWREPILSVEAWRQLGDVLRSSDAAGARAAYRRYLEHRAPPATSPALRRLRALLSAPPAR
ncbi:MAG: serine/threonine-protein kinase [Kofleriaceae bacterium]